MPFGVVGKKILMSRIEWKFILVRFLDSECGRYIIDFEVISTAANSNKFPKKTRFWKEKIQLRT